MQLNQGSWLHLESNKYLHPQNPEGLDDAGLQYMDWQVLLLTNDLVHVQQVAMFRPVLRKHQEAFKKSCSLLSSWHLTVRQSHKHFQCCIGQVWPCTVQQVDLHFPRF
jgi:hypothetical protein